MEEQLAPSPPPRAFTMRPALIVGALAVVILVVFSLGAALTHVATGKGTRTAATATAPGAGLRAGATTTLGVLRANGQPPTNVLHAIALPAGAVRGAHTDPGAGATFDQEVQFTLGASQAAVLRFYTAEMKSLGWHTVSTGAAPHQPGQEIVGQLAGDDGYYWQLGVVVSPSTFAQGGTSDLTRFTLRVLQVGDDS